MDDYNLNSLIQQTKELKVLYVEDDEDTRNFTLTMLENFFSDISVEIDGEKGLQRFKNGKYNAIFTDINMPNMNGIEMIETIRDLDLDVPIIMLSAYDDVEYFLKTIKVGIDGYLLKPFNFSQLEDVMKKIIEKRNDNFKVKLIEEFYWDKREEKLYKNKTHITLTKSEILLFRLLSSLKNTSYSAIDIEVVVFDDDINDTARVRNLLSRLKNKLNSNLIKSIYGHGYQLNQ